MLKEKEKFCREFIVTNQIDKKVSFENLLHSKHPIYLISLENTNITTMVTVVNNRKYILKYIGVTKLRKHSKKVLTIIFKEMTSFVSYMAELKLYRKIQVEENNLKTLLESVEKKILLIHYGL
jgi:hypothetical protein